MKYCSCCGIPLTPDEEGSGLCRRCFSRQFYFVAKERAAKLGKKVEFVPDDPDCWQIVRGIKLKKVK